MVCLLDNATSEQFVDQAASGAADPRLYGSQWAVEHMADFFVAKLLLMEQAKRHPVLVPQGAQRAIHFFGQVTGGLQIGRAVGYDIGKTPKFGLAFPFGKQGTTPVACDGQQPRSK